MPDTLEASLFKHFQYKTFRDGQKESIESILAGQDTLTVMPTGSGKSLVYQLAALLIPGTTLVVSPLVALMKDQAESMARRKIPCTFINSSLSHDENTERMEMMRHGRFRVVLVAPERFRNPQFMEAGTLR